MASALTGASNEPKAGNYVMVRDRSAPSHRAGHQHERTRLDDQRENELVPERVAIARYRDLLGDEAIDLSDEDIEAVRQHARAMVHPLIEVFLQQRDCGRG